MKFKELLKSKPFWTCLIAIFTALSAFFLAGCFAGHSVTQSSSSYRSGDTLTTVIRYEQLGNLKK